MADARNGFSGRRASIRSPSITCRPRAMSISILRPLMRARARSAEVADYYDGHRSGVEMPRASLFSDNMTRMSRRARRRDGAARVMRDAADTPMRRITTTFDAGSWLRKRDFLRFVEVTAQNRSTGRRSSAHSKRWCRSARRMMRGARRCRRRQCRRQKAMQNAA